MGNAVRLFLSVRRARWFALAVFLVSVMAASLHVARAGEIRDGKLSIAILPFSGQAKVDGYGDALRQAVRDGFAQLRATNIIPAKTIAEAATGLGVSLIGDLTDEQRLALGRKLHARFIIGGTYTGVEDGVTVKAWLADVGAGSIVQMESVNTAPEAYLAAPHRVFLEALRQLDVRPTTLESKRLRQFFGDEPTTPEQYVRYAQAMWAEELSGYENHARALTLMFQATQADANFALGHLALARVLGTGSRWKAAGEVRAALSINPEMPDANRLLGDLLMAAPEHPFDKAIEAYQAALTQAPDDMQARVDLANARLGKGDADGAIREYRSALEWNPRDEQVHYGLGKLYNDKGSYERAVAELRRATALDPEFVDAWVSLGEVYEDKGLYEKAIDSYRRALAVQPNHSGATYDLALAYEHVNMPKAVEAWKRYIAQAEQSSTDQNWIGIARKHLQKLGREETATGR